MSKIYIITDVGWDYDDNYYYRSDGTIPRKAFRDEKKAQEFLDTLNVRSFKNEWSSIREYGEGSYILNIPHKAVKKADKLFNRLFELTAEEWLQERNADFVVEPTEEDWKDLYSYFNVEFHELTEIDIDDEEV